MGRSREILEEALLQSSEEQHDDFIAMTTSSSSSSSSLLGDRFRGAGGFLVAPREPFLPLKAALIRGDACACLRWCPGGSEPLLRMPTDPSSDASDLLWSVPSVCVCVCVCVCIYVCVCDCVCVCISIFVSL